METEEKLHQRLRLKEFLDARNPDLWSLVATVALFVLVTYLVGRYQLFFTAVLGGGGIWGMALFTILAVVSVVVPPVNSIVLTPIASAAYGVVPTALLSILGWTVGSMLAFYIARVYGEHIVRHFPSLARSSHIERLVSERYIFWSVVFLKMTFPVDILSYALGFFSRISFSLYFWATVVGITPFAFVFASLGGLSTKTQLLVIGVSSALFLPYWYFMARRKKVE